jgi:hypothetical protein
MFNNLKLYVFFIALFTGVKTQAINFSFTDTIKNVSGEITEMKELYNNGKTREIIRLKNNKLHGVQKSFNNKGILLSETEYNDGLLCGISKKYNNEGQLKEKKTYNCNLPKNSSCPFKIKKVILKMVHLQVTFAISHERKATKLKKN